MPRDAAADLLDVVRPERPPLDEVLADRALPAKLLAEHREHLERRQVAEPDGPLAERDRVRAREPPPLEDEVWLRSVSHSLDAFWVLARTQGECAYAGRDLARGVAHYELRWT